MELEVKKLNALRKYTGDFGFEYSPDVNLCLIPLSRIEGSVKVTGEYEIFDLPSGILLRGNVLIVLKMPKRK